MRKQMLNFMWLLIGVSLISIGIALMNKSGLGQTAYSGLATTIGLVTHIKSGTVLIIFNMSCVIGQIVFLGKAFHKLQWLQVIVAYLSGLMVNFWIYDFSLTSTYIPGNYLTQWVLTILGIIVISIGVAIVMASETIKMPLEAFVLVISERIKRPFAQLRTLVDVISIILGLFLILIFHLGFETLREGTWISLVLLGSSMGITFPLAQKVLSLSHRMLDPQDIQGAHK
ncbi:MAG: hypothetical protein HGB31_07885 [Erysipelotrichaceae bacterium]|jgi:uncharacterized membrane protein YczE|nr:hypothetical protein [Erysipelotrichaceae bacterium]